jgi:ribosome maturation factor RimP
MVTTDKNGRITEIIENTASELGYMIYEFSAVPRGRNTRVIVRLDHINGIAVNDCESYSRLLMERLDGLEMLENYSLEVSSPGLNRKLRSPEEFARFTGAPAKVIYEREGVRAVFKGVIADVSDGVITLTSGADSISLVRSEISNASLDY